MRWKPRSPTIAAGSAELMPLLLVGAPLRHLGALYNCAVAIHRGAILGVVPKIHLPNYREFYEPRHFVSGDGTDGGCITIGAHTAPFGPDLLFEASDIPGLVVHAEICEDVWVPNPAERGGGASPAPPCWQTCPPATSPSARPRRAACCAARNPPAASPRICTRRRGQGNRPPTSPGTARRRCSRTAIPWPRPNGFRSADQAAIADIDLDLLAQERLQMGIVRHQPPPPCARRSAASASGSTRRQGDVGFRRRVERFPFVPADVSRLEQDCYEAYNIQVSGLAQRLRATGLKKVVIGISGGLDSTQALLVCAQAFDLLGLPRDGILAYTMPGFATSDHTKVQCVAADEIAGRDRGGTRYQTCGETDAGRSGASLSRRGESVYDITFENVQAGLRTDYLFRLANHHRRHRHRHRRPVRTRAGLVHLWRRRPDGALQRQCRRAEDADPASDPLDHRRRNVSPTTCWRRWTRSWRPKSPPNWSPSPRAKSRKAPRPRSAPTRCRISRCSIFCATASCRRRSPSWRCTPGKIRTKAPGRRISTTTAGSATT